MSSICETGNLVQVMMLQDCLICTKKCFKVKPLDGKIIAVAGTAYFGTGWLRLLSQA